MIMNQKVLDKQIDIIDVIGDNNTLDKVISKLQNLEQQTSHYVETRLIKEYYGYDGGFELNLYCYRLETDEELAARLEKERILEEKRERALLKKLKKERNKNAAKEANEKAEYERLKEKYGA